jgi:hypothetical protein
MSSLLKIFIEATGRFLFLKPRRLRYLKWLLYIKGQIAEGKLQKGKLIVNGLLPTVNFGKLNFYRYTMPKGILSLIKRFPKLGTQTK